MNAEHIEEQLAPVREQWRGDWDHPKTEAQLAQLHRILDRRRRRRVALLAAAAILLCLGATWWLTPSRHDVPEQLATSPATIRLEDGTTLQATDQTTDLRIVHVSEDRVSTQMHRGTAYFSVTPNAGRTFEVNVEDTVVDVLGTKFEIAHTPGQSIKVRVDEGVVRVVRGHQRNLIHAGEELTLSLTSRPKPPDAVLLDEQKRERGDEQEERARASTTSAPSSSQEKRQEASPRKNKGRWRLLARAEKREEAAKALLETSEELSGAEDLMLAADLMRSVRHHDRALSYLERVLDEHPEDARASLAAYTMGRILLKNKREPVRAADMFARVQSLHPGGTLAEDALAGEIEALAKSNNTPRLERRIAHYIATYPQGVHLARIKTYGGAP